MTTEQFKEFVQRFSEDLDQDFPGFFTPAMEDDFLSHCVRYALWETIGWFEIKVASRHGQEGNTSWSEFKAKLAHNLGGSDGDELSHRVMPAFQAWLLNQTRFISGHVEISHQEEGIHLLGLPRQPFSLQSG
jgi:hypothetical protein